MSAKALSEYQHKLLHAFWPNNCCLCRQERENLEYRFASRKTIRKQAFLEAAETVENMSSGKVAGFKTVKETWQTIVETLREKAEE